MLSSKVAHRLTPRTPLEGAILPPAEGSELAVTADYSPLWFDELRLRAGERVTFLCQICPGWFRGRQGGKVGVFPGTHVELA